MNIKTIDGISWGAGFLVNREDLEFVPLSRARAVKCWIGDEGNFSVLSCSFEKAINIPEKHYWSMLKIEKDAELGNNLIDRYIKLRENKIK